MTVQELIDELQKHPMDNEVAISNVAYGYGSGVAFVETTMGVTIIEGN